MSEETILKNTFFGGYKKSDVIQYIDDLLGENEKKLKQMEEQILFLVKENNRLKAKKQEGTPIPFPTVTAVKAEKKSDISIHQQMELPEGSYMIGKDNKVVTLPDPNPIYQTKKPNDIPESVKESSKYMEAQEIKAEVTSYVAATKENQEVNEIEKINEDTNLPAPQPQSEMNDLKQLKAELLEVKEKLEKEKQEKERLTTKLEYSNELLLQLYQNK